MWTSFPSEYSFYHIRQVFCQVWWLTSVTTALRRLAWVWSQPELHSEFHDSPGWDCFSYKQRTSRCRHSVLFMSLASIHIFFCLYMCKFTFLCIKSATSGIILRNADTGSLVSLEALITLAWLATTPLGCWSSLSQHQGYKCTPPSQASLLGAGERTRVLILVGLARYHWASLLILLEIIWFLFSFVLEKLAGPCWLQHRSSSSASRVLGYRHATKLRPGVD